MTKDFTPESFEATKQVLDTIYSLRARLVHLSMLSQFYRAAKSHLVRGRESTIAHALSGGLPYEPFRELEHFIAEQLRSYPILEVEPYPPDAFQRLTS